MRYLKERQEVMKTAQEIFRTNMVTGTYGNVSLRITSEPLMIITPSGMDYESLTVEDMVLTDLQGEVVEGQWKPSTESVLHGMIYSNRSDVGAIVHVHSLGATAFAIARQKIPVLIEECAQVVGHEIEVAEYAVCGSRELAENTVAALKQGKAVLLANHGLIGVGLNTSEALNVCAVVEKTARLALWTQQLGNAYPLSPADINRLHQNYKNYGQKKP